MANENIIDHLHRVVQHVLANVLNDSLLSNSQNTATAENRMTTILFYLNMKFDPKGPEHFSEW